MRPCSAFLSNLFGFWTKCAFNQAPPAQEVVSDDLCFVLGLEEGEKEAGYVPIPKAHPHRAVTARTFAPGPSEEARGERGRLGQAAPQPAAPPRKREGAPAPGGGPCLSRPAVLTRTRARCFRNVAFALPRCWMPRKVTRNDLNASFPWCEGCSREPLNEGGAFFSSCECSLCCYSPCRPVLSPGLKSAPDCVLSVQQPPAWPGPGSQPWRDCLG